MALASDFVRDIQPILEKHCVACHGAAKQKSGLRLDIRSEAFRGGDGRGSSIIAGKPDESPIWQLVSTDDVNERMPPDGPGLSDAEKITLRDWIAQGAEWPAGVDKAALADRLDHWSFKPRHSVIPPTVADATWPNDAIDNFVVDKLRSAGLAPQAPTDKGTWLRRVTFDLTGLPPTIEQLHHFQEDTAPDAELRVIDRLLASPRYGEYWAQHWLDVVRYADTHGFEVNTERPNAWPYRDFVIDAFNEDMPYDDFIRYQIIGDQLADDRGTGFLLTASVLLPGQIGQDEASKRLARQDAIDEIVVNIGQTFLGLSIGCARCHDHKFDPISQVDYYSMQALVAGVEYEDREIRTPEAVERRAHVLALRTEQQRVQAESQGIVPRARSGDVRAPINAMLNVDRFMPVEATGIKFTIYRTNNLEPCIDELEVFNSRGENVASASSGATVSSRGDKTSPNRHELRFLNDEHYGNSRSWMSSEEGKGEVVIRFASPQTIDRVHWGRDRNGEFKDRLAMEYVIEIQQLDGSWKSVADERDRAADPAQITPNEMSKSLTPEERSRRDQLQSALKQLQSEIQSKEIGMLVFAGKFREPDAIRVLLRGDPEQPKAEVAPAVPSSLGNLTWANSTPEPERRRHLADWLTQPDHPLTARVMANRIWQGHFGIGVVETPSDFGRMGSPPSHPELLDYLADEFIRHAWSVKAMHRHILHSAVYAQSSRYVAEAAAIDADARLLWRYPPRRLEGESLRDTMLSVSGELRSSMYGPGFNLFDQRGGLSGFKPIEQFGEAGLRRMIYAHKIRRERDAVFGAFDCPDAGQSTARRRESTTPIQALNLLNSPFTLDRARAMADRLKRDHPIDDASRIRAAFESSLGRLPDDDELQKAQEIVGRYDLPTFCRVLLNCNEFIYVR